MRFNSLEKWLTWLEACHPTEIDLGLDRTYQVARDLDLLKPAKQSVVVAGTNGKGSCVATLSTLLLSHKLKVGTYTSPHIKHFSERICIDLKPVTNAELCAAFSVIDKARGDISLTYFEFATLAALEIFKRNNVDVCVLEVGLGGRLDAVNVIDADVSVVTSIGIDHESWLGSDREIIGSEKAGVFRKNKPAICAEPAAPESLQRVAKKVGADFRQINVDFSFGVSRESAEQETWWWALGGERESIVCFEHLPQVSLPLQSVAAGLYAMHCLGIKLDVKQLNRVLPTLALPGRMQKVLYKDRHFLLDVAHNPQATEYLARRVRQTLLAGARVFGIVAMMQDKDRQGSLTPLLEYIDVWIPVALANTPRVTTVTDITRDLSVLKQAVSFSGTMRASIDWSVKQSDPLDLIVIFGSFFTVAEALDALHHENICINREDS